MSESPIRRVAVRGDDAAAETFAEAGVDVVGLDDADAVVAVGEPAFEGAALSGSDRPLIPVGVAGRHHGVDADSAAAAAAALRGGDYRTVAHPVLQVDVAGERVGRAVFDVTLMTSEPARISEYALSVAGERRWSGRADGVVVASPFGSEGYGRAAGGPVVVDGEALTVVPVAPFATRTDSWVVDGPLELSVERDEGDVSLFTDDRERRRVGRGDPVRVTRPSEFTVARPVVDRPTPD